jgi:hypothetical protein
VAVVRDVALQQGGLLVGRITGSAGSPISGARIQLASQGRMIGETSTDPHGTFDFAGLRGGSYQLIHGSYSSNLRLWAPGTAPPSAKEMLLIVEPASTSLSSVASRTAQPYPETVPTNTVTLARTQSPGGGPIRELFSRPLILGGLVATAIAVPVAIHNHDSGTTVITE